MVYRLWYEVNILRPGKPYNERSSVTSLIIWGNMALKYLMLDVALPIM